MFINNDPRYAKVFFLKSKCEIKQACSLVFKPLQTYNKDASTMELNTTSTKFVTTEIQCTEQKQSN